MKPVLLGVTVYVPVANPENVYTPEAFAVVVAVAAPVSFTVAALPPGPLIVPVMLNLCTELKLTVKLDVLMVTLWLAGVKTKPPALLGVTV
jgi:hypothetical protein